MCIITGLTDEARADFRVMKDVAEYTRVGPGGRTKTLQELVNVINRLVCKKTFFLTR